MHLTRAHAGIKPGGALPDILTRQHRRIECLLFGLLAPSLDLTSPQSTKRFAELAGLLRRHVEIEDNVLFPTFSRSPGSQEGELAAHLSTQHREFEWGLDFIWSLFTGRAPSQQIRGHLETFDDLLARHFRREEWVVYAVFTTLECATA